MPARTTRSSHVRQPIREVKDLTGQRFGQLVALHMAFVKVLNTDSKYNPSFAVWLCSCDCGRTHRVRGTALTQGRTTKCPMCRSREMSVQQQGRHVGKLCRDYLEGYMRHVVGPRPRKAGRPRKPDYPWWEKVGLGGKQ